MQTKETLNQPKPILPILRGANRRRLYYQSRSGNHLQRQENRLEEIRSLVCLKFYNDISEKLENENGNLSSCSTGKMPETKPYPITLCIESLLFWTKFLELKFNNRAYALHNHW